jgi:hypothetical protein
MVLETGDLVCYKGNREELASIAQVQSIDYGAGRIIKKAMVIWLTGPKVGKRHVYDLRDLVKVEE